MKIVPWINGNRVVTHLVEGHAKKWTGNIIRVGRLVVKIANDRVVAFSVDQEVPMK